MLKMHRLQQISYQLKKQLAWSRTIQYSQSVRQEMAKGITSNTKNSNAKNSSYQRDMSAEWERAKPFKKLPGPSRFQLIRGFMKGGEFQNISFGEFNLRCRQKYGDTFLLPGIGKAPIVSLFDPADFECIYRTEGKYPHRPGTEAFTYYREQRRQQVCPETIGFSASNEEWADFRSKVNPVVMKPQNARLYFDPMMCIMQDFTRHIREIRNPITQEVPGDFGIKTINRLSLEIMVAVTLDKRLGLISNKKLSKETEKLFDFLQSFVASIFELGMKPSFYRFIRTPTYRRFERAIDEVHEILSKFTDEALERIEKQRGVSENKSIVEMLLKIDRNVAILMATDFITGGVETTSSILCATLLLLATNPTKQANLRTELLNAVGHDSTACLTYENVQHLPYLRACIKEALRIHPLTKGHFRTASVDIVLGGHRIPKGTNVLLNTNLLLSEERYFPRAKEFIPERWLRDSDSEHLIASNTSPFVYLPFGYGPRSCVGKRIANLEMELAVANIVRNFSIEFNYPTENAFSYKYLSTPAIPMKFKFTDL